MCGAADKVDHLSEQVARNAVELHLWEQPHCPGFNHYPCGDHFHVGHKMAGGRQVCMERHADYRRGVPLPRATLQQ